VIKLTPVPKPAQLTKPEQARLTRLFKKTGESVWQKAYIVNALRAMSNSKCCYCECNLIEESKYLEVEHYQHKDKYKALVMEWSNLLPSCKRCNVNKKDHDVKADPIIHPAKVYPNKHLMLIGYRIKGFTKLGKETETVLYLNDTIKLCQKRFELAEKLTDSLDTLYELTKEYFDGTNKSAHRRNRIVSSFKGIITQCLPTSVFSATLSTVLLKQNSVTYKELKSMFQKKGIWDNELIGLEKRAKSIALKIK